jgi:enoyl-CoA hydratase/carnithine racemase
MLRHIYRRPARIVARGRYCLSSAAAREFKYYDNVEVKEGVAILRLNGPGKMNTLCPDLQNETGQIFKNKIAGNPSIKAVVFISSKPDNFIAGADIDMIKNTADKSTLVGAVMKGHALFNEVKKVR